MAHTPDEMAAAHHGTARAPRRSVLQELARTWSVFRLYPNEPDREEFAVAVERLGDAVGRAADGSTCRLELRRGRFVDPDGVEDLSAAATAVADALYRQGIEVIDLEADLSRRMLADVYLALEAASDGLDDYVDAETSTLRLGRVRPAVATRDGHAGRSDALWDALGDARAQAVQLVEHYGPQPDGDDVLAWFRDLDAALDEERSADAEFVHRVQRIVGHLPADARENVDRAMLDAQDDEHLAARYVDAMPDVELARTLAGRPEPEVHEHIDRYVSSGRRRPGFEELVGWWRTVGDDDEAATDLPTVELVEPDPELAVARTVATYLVQVDDPTDAGPAVSRWKHHVHAALADRDRERSVRVLNPVSAVEQDLPAAVRRLIDVALETALDHTDVVALLPEDPEAEAVEARALIAPLGAGGITMLMTALAAERRRVNRSQLVGLIASLVPGHLDRLEPWLRDERWFVVRNVMTILSRVGDPSAEPLVDQALRHSEPRVRLEAARALRGLGTDSAVERLRQMVDDPDEHVRLATVETLAASTRRAAIDALRDVGADTTAPRDARERVVELLGEHPSREATDRLRELIDGGELPRRVRNRASVLLARREGDR